MGIDQTDVSAAQMPASIFLSYAHDDRAKVTPIIAALEKAGMNVWWDGAIEAGTKFAHSIEDALEKADVVLVVWSAKSINSNWVLDEATSGADNRRLVPVRIDDVQPPLGFRQFQVADLSKWNKKHDSAPMQSVIVSIESVRSGRGIRREMHGISGAKPGVNRRSLILGSGLALLAAGGFAAWQQDWFSGTEDRASNSIAILPFANLSGDPAQDYFSNGLSEELRVTLNRNSALNVAAEASSNSFGKDKRDAKAIAGKLNVVYLLDGSVRRSGDVVRVTVQLINGTTGFESWSESYDRKMVDIFAVQSEIAQRVASSLAVKMGGKEKDGQLRPGSTTNPAAFDAYLRGRALYELATDENSDRAALAQFNAAIAADPEYAAAYAARARVQTAIANSSGDGARIRRLYDQAIASARKAVALAPGLAIAHAALGYVLLNGRLDIKAAGEPYRKALETGGGDAGILESYATYMARVGKFAEAQRAIEKALKLDPLNPPTARTKGLIEYSSRQFDAAKASLARTLDLNPDMRIVNAILGNIAYLQKDYGSAAKYYAQEPNDFARNTGLAINYDKMGERDKARRALREIVSKYGDNSLYQQASVYAQWGKTDSALDALEKARKVGDSGLVLMRNDPMLTPLHDTRRFARMLNDLGFPPL